MRRLLVILITCLSLLAGFPRPALAKSDPRRDQIEAAQADALGALLDEVRAARLTPELTVGEFLNRTRWPNPGTCQVQLEVPSDAVVQALVAIARDDPAKSPVPAEVIEKRLASAW